MKVTANVVFTVFVIGMVSVRFENLAIIKTVKRLPFSILENGRRMPIATNSNSSVGEQKSSVHCNPVVRRFLKTDG